MRLALGAIAELATCALAAPATTSSEKAPATTSSEKHECNSDRKYDKEWMDICKDVMGHVKGEGENKVNGNKVIADAGKDRITADHPMCHGECCLYVSKDSDMTWKTIGKVAEAAMDYQCSDETLVNVPRRVSGIKGYEDVAVCFDKPDKQCKLPKSAKS